jgi:3-O-methylgallate 3,4-dioxygenase
MPSIALYYGDTIRNGGPEPVPAADWFGQARQGYHEPKIEATYPCAGALARHLIAGLVAREFDISTLDRLPDGHCEGHAYGFVHRHYLAGTRVPILPVFLNTYYPPNQPTPRRCVALGRAIADLVASYPEDSRIGILGSGGLSHFLIDASLDRSIIDAFGRKDLEFLAGLDPRRLQSGSSEIRNWLVMAAAAQALDLAWVSYIPGYRSAALTGTGLCFARWC